MTLNGVSKSLIFKAIIFLSASAFAESVVVKGVTYDKPASLKELMSIVPGVWRMKMSKDCVQGSRVEDPESEKFISDLEKTGFGVQANYQILNFDGKSMLTSQAVTFFEKYQATCSISYKGSAKYSSTEKFVEDKMDKKSLRIRGCTSEITSAIAATYFEEDEEDKFEFHTFVKRGSRDQMISIPDARSVPHRCGMILTRVIEVGS